MTEPWRGPPPPTYAPTTVWERLRGGGRLLVFVAGTIVLLIPFLLLRLLGGTRDRWVAKMWSYVALWCLGLKLEQTGKPIANGVLAANHISWIDPLALGAAASTYFVAKREVASWPFIGLLCRLGRVEFVTRTRADAHRQTRIVEGRVNDGHLLTIFPEGTSSDGRQVLPFRSTLFAALFNGTAHQLVQPVAVSYRPSPDNGLPEDHYGWWGEMGFVDHLWAVLCRSRRGRVTVAFLPSLSTDDFGDRKELAVACQAVVAQHLGQPQGK